LIRGEFGHNWVVSIVLHRRRNLIKRNPKIFRRYGDHLL